MEKDLYFLIAKKCKDKKKHINYFLKTYFCTELPQKSVKKQPFG